ncbi:fibronectin type III domain-containing protein [Candidatus Uhrbacteria bacterium]|nr:fibronectin type III domain-containing protein [Candidatus Uhrbacteria bacterium]
MRDFGHFVEKIFKNVMSDSKKRKSWQSGLGITIFTLFVLSSAFVNQSVQALNQAAGNYGYYSGSYGYNAARTSSDAPPRAPTSLSTSSMQQTSVTVSWTAPTTTTLGTAIATGSGSISTYLIHYSTSAQSGCSGGSSTTSTSTSVSLSSLTAGTTYNVAVCARDNNLNDSAALTGSFTTTSSGGGTAAVASGGGGGGATGPTFPTAAPTVAAPAATTGVTPVAPIVTPTVSVNIVKDATALAQAVGVVRNTAAETQNTAKVGSSAGEFKVTLGAEVSAVASNFVTYGTINSAVKALGSGERLAVVRDMLETLGATVAADAGKFLLAAEQISNGQKPTVRNLTKEVAQAGVARDKYWKVLTGKSAPDFKVAKEDLAWNTMLYRIRFKRDLVKERVGITKFKAVFGRIPKSPIDWATVRAWGYALQ